MNYASKEAPTMQPEFLLQSILIIDDDAGSKRKPLGRILTPE